jgi:hypothetical protein
VTIRELQAALDEHPDPNSAAWRRLATVLDRQLLQEVSQHFQRLTPTQRLGFIAELQHRFVIGP